MTATAPATPEAEVVALRAALAEAGYPDAIVYVGPENGEPTIRHAFDDQVLVPMSVAWRAFAVVCPARLVACWACFENPDIVGPCEHDPLTSPWPEVVR